MPRFGLDYALDSLGGALGSGGGSCDFSTYFNGTGNVNVDFVDVSGDMVPATGPLSLESTSPVDTISSTYTFDPDQDWFYEIDVFVTDVVNNDRIFIIRDSGDSTNLIQVLFMASNTLRVFARTTNTTSQTIDFVGGFVLDVQKRYGIRYDAGTSTIFATVDGVDSSSGKVVDFTGITLDEIVIGTSASGVNNPEMLLTAANSDLVGDTNFISRLRTENDPNGSKFFSDATTPAEYVVLDSSPKGLWFPYDLNGVPTDYNTTYLVSDTKCAGNGLVINGEGIAVQNADGTFIIT